MMADEKNMALILHVVCSIKPCFFIGKQKAIINEELRGVA
jgi:hypothetical protein